MISGLATYLIGGVPVIIITGALTLILFICVAIIGLGIFKGWFKVKLKWHYKLAAIALIVGIFHGLLGLALFLGF